MTNTIAIDHILLLKEKYAVSFLEHEASNLDSTYQQPSIGRLPDYATSKGMVALHNYSRYRLSEYVLDYLRDFDDADFELYTREVLQLQNGKHSSISVLFSDNLADFKRVDVNEILAELGKITYGECSWHFCLD